MIHALFPQCTVSVHVMWGLKQQNTVFAIGVSILNRSSNLDVGALCLAYGGGGHQGTGTCQVANDRANLVMDELIGRINAAGGDS
jgi:nanoRNase/pAp phosphatase (c-di-AMP/oligoRNAs hydrolase)